MPKIMVVDDEKSIVYLIKVLLEREQFEVAEAYDGLEAYNALAAAAPGSLPDLMILDTMMPVMDGYTLQARLRETAGLDKIPIVILTGKDSQTRELFALADNIFAFMEKPFKPKDLVKTVKDALAAAKAKRNP